MSAEPFEPKATLYGAFQFVLYGGYCIVRMFFVFDPIIDFILTAVFGITNLGLLFYGQSLVKRLNRNYFGWAIALFFVMPIALIVLGQLARLPGKIEIIEFAPEDQNKNVNELPRIKFATENSMLNETLASDELTIRHMMHNYRQYQQEYSKLMPLICAYELNRRNEKLNENDRINLDKYAEENGYSDFAQMIGHIKIMGHSEMATQFA